MMLVALPQSADASLLGRQDLAGVGSSICLPFSTSTTTLGSDQTHHFAMTSDREQHDRHRHFSKCY